MTVATFRPYGHENLATFPGSAGCTYISCLLKGLPKNARFPLLAGDVILGCYLDAYKLDSNSCCEDEVLVSLPVLDVFGQEAVNDLVKSYRNRSSNSLELEFDRELVTAAFEEASMRYYAHHCSINNFLPWLIAQTQRNNGGGPLLCYAANGVKYIQLRAHLTAKTRLPRPPLRLILWRVPLPPQHARKIHHYSQEVKEKRTVSQTLQPICAKLSIRLGELPELTVLTSTNTVKTRYVRQTTASRIL